MKEKKTNDFLTVGGLKTILEELPDEMPIVIPVIDEDDVNRIYGFRKVKTAGILECEFETENEKKVLCVNGASDGYDIADQVHFSGRDVSVITVLYGENNDKITDEQWKEAIHYLNMVIAEYASIGWTGQFGLQGVLIPLKKRFDKGERTRELYDAIMKVE